MSNCDNCGTKKAGLVDTGSGKLCLNCYERFQNARSISVQQDAQKISDLATIMGHYEEVMEYQLGFRSTPPKLNLPYRGIAVNQNINLSNSAVGILNSGPNSSGSINCNTYNNGLSSEQLQNLLTQLIARIPDCSEITQNNKEVLIESIYFINDELKKAQINKTMLKIAIEKITDLSVLSIAIQQLWNSCLPMIQTTFGLIS